MLTEKLKQDNCHQKSNSDVIWVVKDNMGSAAHFGNFFFLFHRRLYGATRSCRRTKKRPIPPNLGSTWHLNDQTHRQRHLAADLIHIEFIQFQLWKIFPFHFWESPTLGHHLSILKIYFDDKNILDSRGFDRPPPHSIQLLERNFIVNFNWKKLK